MAAVFVFIALTCALDAAAGATHQELASDHLAGEDVCSGSSDSSCALNELQSVAKVSKNMVEKATLRDSGDCAISIDSATDLPLPVTIGTNQNMPDTSIVDLTGLWWVNAKTNLFMWNTGPFQGLIIYSFAGSNGTGSGFPLRVSSPIIGALNQGAFEDTLRGKVYMASNPVANEPYGTTQWAFTNSSYARVTFGATNPWAYNLKKVDSDDWKLGTGGNPTLITDGTNFKDYQYSMLRIVNADGSKGAHWSEYEEVSTTVSLLGNAKNVRVWASNEQCPRKATAWVSVFWWGFLPQSWACGLAMLFCSCCGGLF